MDEVYGRIWDQWSLNLYNIIRFNVTLNSNFFPMLTLNLDKHQLEREIVKYEREKKWVTKKCVRERERV